MVVEHRRDDRLTSEFLNALSYGRDPSASMKRALKGNSRGLQIHFLANARPSKRKGSN